MNEKSENSKVSVSNYGSLPLLKTDRNPDDSNRLKHSCNIDRRLLTVRSVTVTSDDRYLIITFGNSPKIRVVDLQKLEYVPHKFDSHKDTVRLISPCNDNTFYTASWDGRFMHFNILTGEGKLLFCSNRSPSVFLDANQKYLFVAEYPDLEIDDRNLGRCWDLQNKRTIAIYKHKKDRIAPESIDIAYDQNHVFTGGDGVLYKWNLTDSEPVHTYFDCFCGIRKIAVSNTYVAAASNDGLIRVYYKNHAFFKNFRVSDTDVKDVKIAKDESFIVGCSDNGIVKSWSLKTGEELYCKRVHKSVIWSICLFNNDTMLVTGGTDGRINILDAGTGRIICRMLNFPWDNEMLIAMPPDKYFPKGLFYSTNTNRILVFAENENGNRDILPQNSRERIAYINKFNCKNLILSRLKSEKNFTLISEMHLKNQKKITPFFERKFPKFFGIKA